MYRAQEPRQVRYCDSEASLNNRPAGSLRGKRCHRPPNQRYKPVQSALKFRHERPNMPGILCEHCTGYCCRYIALPIDTPEDKDDFDAIRWYLLHEGIGVFVEDGDWYLSISTNCRHLQPDFRCGIYETRPQICRDYSTDNCDYHSGDYGWSHHFSSPEHFDEYVRTLKRSKTAKKSSKKRTKKRGGARVKLSKRPIGKPRVKPIQAPAFAAALADVRGIPLPVLQFGERRS